MVGCSNHPRGTFIYDGGVSPQNHYFLKGIWRMRRCFCRILLLRVSRRSPITPSSISKPMAQSHGGSRGHAITLWDQRWGWVWLMRSWSSEERNLHVRRIQRSAWGNPYWVERSWSRVGVLYNPSNELRIPIKWEPAEEVSNYLMLRESSMIKQKSWIKVFTWILDKRIYTSFLHKIWEYENHYGI